MRRRAVRVAFLAVMIALAACAADTTADGAPSSYRGTVEIVVGDTPAQAALDFSFNADGRVVWTELAIDSAAVCGDAGWIGSSPATLHGYTSPKASATRVTGCETAPDDWTLGPATRTAGAAAWASLVDPADPMAGLAVIAGEPVGEDMTANEDGCRVVASWCEFSGLDTLPTTATFELDDAGRLIGIVLQADGELFGAPGQTVTIEVRYDDFGTDVDTDPPIDIVAVAPETDPSSIDRSRRTGDRLLVTMSGHPSLHEGSTHGEPLIELGWPGVHSTNAGVPAVGYVDGEPVVAVPVLWTAGEPVSVYGPDQATATDVWLFRPDGQQLGELAGALCAGVGSGDLIALAPGAHDGSAFRSVSDDWDLGPALDAAAAPHRCIPEPTADGILTAAAHEDGAAIAHNGTIVHHRSGCSEAVPDVHERTGELVFSRVCGSVGQLVVADGVGGEETVVYELDERGFGHPQWDYDQRRIVATVAPLGSTDPSDTSAWLVDLDGAIRDLDYPGAVAVAFLPAG